MVKVVGENTTAEAAQEALHYNAGLEQQHAREAAAADHEAFVLQTTGEASHKEALQSSPEAVVAGTSTEHVVSDALGIGPAASMVGMAVEVVRNSPGKAEMDTFTSQNTNNQTDAFRCIQTPHSFPLADRNRAGSGSFLGDDKAKGLQSTEKDVAALHAKCSQALGGAKIAGIERGNAYRYGNEINATNGMQMTPNGMGGGASRASQLALNQRVPKGPTHIGNGEGDGTSGSATV